MSRSVLGLLTALIFLIAASGCRGSSGQNSLTGTYVQEGVQSSPLTSRIILKDDKTFEMAGMVHLKGTYEVQGQVLRLIPGATQSTALPPDASGPLTCTLNGGVIEMPSGLANLPATKFKKH
jgi:hypothetical protein